MPTVNREDDFTNAMVTSFKGHDLMNQIRMVGQVVLVMFTMVLPEKLMTKLGIKENRPNVGRLQEVIPGQIWQQNYFGGNTNGTVFKSRNGDGLLLYVAPRMTPEFLEDVAGLGAPVKYLLIPDCVHETFGEDAKKAFPDAVVLCPESIKSHIDEVVPVEKTVEDLMDSTLKNDYGFAKMFKFDDHFVMGAQRCFQVEKFESNQTDNNKNKGASNILFVGQCGIGNFPYSYYMHALGFSSPSNGRMFRHFWYSFTKNRPQVPSFWLNMVSSIPKLEAAIFLHGTPIQGQDTKEKLLKFYIPGQ